MYSARGIHDFVIRADDGPIRGRRPDLLKAVADGRISCRTQMNKVRGHEAVFLIARPASGGTIKVHLHSVARKAGELLKDSDQFELVIRGIQPQTEFWDQVMAVDEV